MALFTIQNEFRYEIVRKIFEGGMGIVYEAEQHGAREFVKRVAIKVIRQNYADQKQFIENFIGEAKLVADLIHTNIVQTYHLGETNGVYFIAMELIRGVNLEQFAQQLADKADAAQGTGRFHRQPRRARTGLRPRQNRQGRQTARHRPSRRQLQEHHDRLRGRREADGFRHRQGAGFSDRQEGEVVAGKADYMSPEQANFQITDKRSDIFSAGVVLAHLLLGRNIFKGGTPEESTAAHDELPMPDFRNLDPRVDDRLNEILRRALAATWPSATPAPMNCSTTWSTTSTIRATARRTKRSANTSANCSARTPPSPTAASDSRERTQALVPGGCPRMKLLPERDNRR